LVFNGAHAGASWLTDSSHSSKGSGADVDGGIPNSSNLNLSAAMLHLIADVVRGITILVSAIVIEAGVARDAGKVDAVCALLVAGFIFVGAAAIFQRLFSSLKDLNCWASLMQFGGRRLA